MSEIVMSPLCEGWGLRLHKNVKYQPHGKGNNNDNNDDDSGWWKVRAETLNAVHWRSTKQMVIADVDDIYNGGVSVCYKKADSCIQGIFCIQGIWLFLLFLDTFQK